MEKIIYIITFIFLFSFPLRASENYNKDNYSSIADTFFEYLKRENYKQASEYLKENFVNKKLFNISDNEKALKNENLQFGKVKKYKIISNISINDRISHVIYFVTNLKGDKLARYDFMFYKNLENKWILSLVNSRSSVDSIVSTVPIYYNQIEFSNKELINKYKNEISAIKNLFTDITKNSTDYSIENFKKNNTNISDEFILSIKNKFDMINTDLGRINSCELAYIKEISGDVVCFNWVGSHSGVPVFYQFTYYKLSDECKIHEFSVDADLTSIKNTLTKIALGI